MSPRADLARTLRARACRRPVNAGPARALFVSRGATFELAVNRLTIAAVSILMARMIAADIIRRRRRTARVARAE
jgi:hypothetical protein